MKFGNLDVTATVTFEDGTELVTPTGDRPFDRLMFERRYQLRWLGWDELMEEHLTFMAWVQLNRENIASGRLTFDAFDSWLLNVASVTFDVREPEDTALPTDPVVSTG